MTFCSGLTVSTWAHLVCSSCSSLAPGHVQTYGHHLLQPGCAEASRRAPNRGLWATLTLQSLHLMRQDKVGFILKHDTRLLTSHSQLHRDSCILEINPITQAQEGMIVGVDKLKCGNGKFRLVNKCHLFHNTEYHLYCNFHIFHN